jgi:hypothetical protein
LFFFFSLSNNKVEMLFLAMQRTLKHFWNQMVTKYFYY